MTAEGMVIERDEHEDKFVIVGNSAARDSRISFRARGLHHYLLSLPPGWRVTTEQLGKENPEGREAIRTALNELIKFGYVTREKRQGERGRWSTVMTIRSKPRVVTQSEDAATVTEDGFPGVGGPGVGKLGAIKKTVTKDVKETDQDQKMAPRRAATSGRGDAPEPDSIISEVRRAAASAYGQDQAVWLSDDDCRSMYLRFCCEPDGTPRKMSLGVYAYLTGRPFKDVPDLASALRPARKRSGTVPFDVQVRYDAIDPDDDMARIDFIGELRGFYGPGEEPAVSNMVMSGRPLAYIVAALDSGGLFSAA